MPGSGLEIDTATPPSPPCNILKLAVSSTIAPKK
jgi:hypothetical protein